MLHFRLDRTSFPSPTPLPHKKILSTGLYSTSAQSIFFLILYLILQRGGEKTRLLTLACKLCLLWYTCGMLKNGQRVFSYGNLCLQTHGNCFRVCFVTFITAPFRFTLNPFNSNQILHHNSSSTRFKNTVIVKEIQIYQLVRGVN